MSVLIIAEAGVNHNGESELAFKLIDAAVEAGADIVKFQTFKAANLVTQSATKASYQKKTTGTDGHQFAMLKKLEMSYDLHRELQKYCSDKGIRFLSTAFDHESLEFLVNDLKLDVFKIPSGDITNGPLVLAHAMTGKNIILSTGMSTLGEIEDALGVLAFGYMNQTMEPSRKAFKQAYFSDVGQQLLKNKVSLLHCTTEYPAPLDEINLNVIKTLKSAFGLRVGYSDHSEGISIPIAATALGSCIIEKHFTLDRNMEGPDHKASLEPDELKSMISGIRSIERALGCSVKGPQVSEIENMNVARKSLISKAKIFKGEFFTVENVTVKRPGNGISPMDYWDTINTKSHHDYEVDEILK